MRQEKIYFFNMNTGGTKGSSILIVDDRVIGLRQEHIFIPQLNHDSLKDLVFGRTIGQRSEFGNFGFEAIEHRIGLVIKVAVAGVGNILKKLLVDGEKLLPDSLKSGETR